MTTIEEILIAYASKKHFGMASDVALAEAKKAIRDEAVDIINGVESEDWVGRSETGDLINREHCIAAIKELFK